MSETFQEAADRLELIAEEQRDRLEAAFRLRGVPLIVEVDYSPIEGSPYCHLRAFAGDPDTAHYYIVSPAKECGGEAGFDVGRYNTNDEQVEIRHVRWTADAAELIERWAR